MLQRGWFRRCGANLVRITACRGPFWAALLAIGPPGGNYGRIIATELGVPLEQVLPKTKLVKELGCDSLDVVEIVMAIEGEFGIEIPNAVAYKWFGSMREMASYLRTRRVCSTKDAATKR